MRPAGPASRLLGALLRLRLPVAAPFARDMMLGTRRTRRLHPFMHRPWPRSRARRLHRAAIRADRLLRHPPTRGSEMGSDSRSVRVFTPPRGGTASKSMTITGLPVDRIPRNHVGPKFNFPSLCLFFFHKVLAPEPNQGAPWDLRRGRARAGRAAAAMPLWKRFLALGPKWREQCIDYRVRLRVVCLTRAARRQTPSCCGAAGVSIDQA
jgi:hypothetical protein